MPLTDRISVVADYLYALLETNQEALGLKAVYYGDQDRLPTTPAACVEPDTKARELNGAPRRTQIDLTVFVLVYHSEIRDPQSNRRDADHLSEDIEDLIHTDPTLGELVIHSLVDSIESGYAQKSNGIVRASRVRVTARSQQQLPYA